MSVLIRKSGILSTIQDIGRLGFRRFGINPNGVMDRTAARLINILLGNDENCAVIETHFPAAEIEFESECVFAVGGADLGMTLDGVEAENWRAHRAEVGTKLSFQRKRSGERAYLAVRGGFKVDHWLGSASTNFSAKIGGHHGRKFGAGDIIDTAPDRAGSGSFIHHRISHSIIPGYNRSPIVRAVSGGEFGLLNEKSRELFENSHFQISNDSNRMGYRLGGQPLTLSTPTELLSSAVSFGTVQLLPNGQLIILMADHQTTGGYPRIANVIEYDLPLLAQIGANDKVTFQLIDIREAEGIAASFEHDLNLLKTGVRLCSKLDLGE